LSLFVGKADTAAEIAKSRLQPVFTKTARRRSQTILRLERVGRDFLRHLAGGGPFCAAEKGDVKRRAAELPHVVAQHGWKNAAFAERIYRACFA
jgi:hypothetical protein